MRRRNTPILSLILSLSAGVVGAQSVSDIPKPAGVRGGVIVHLGCGTGEETAKLAAGDGVLVHGIDQDPANVVAARKHVQSLGLYGKAAIDSWDGKHLPYVDNFVNAIVVTRDALNVAPGELARVLTPNGVAIIGEKGNKEWISRVTYRVSRVGDGFVSFTKPRPAEIDDWSHFLHGANNNAVSQDTVVGPPRRMQWVGGPRYSRHHDKMSSVTGVVSAAGRVFCIIDEAPDVSILTAPERNLVARDAFNGTVLWRRPIGVWYNHMHGLKHGPAQLPRRLVAIDDRVYVTLSVGDPVTALDGATGKTLATYEGTENTEEILYSDGKLFLQIRKPTTSAPGRTRTGKKAEPARPHKILKVVDVNSGKTLWTRNCAVENGTLAVDGKRVAFLNRNRIVCLDKNDGKELWQTEPIAVAGRYTVNVTPTLVLYDGVVLFVDSQLAVVNRIWSVDKNDTLTAFSGDTGKKLWDAPHPLSGYYSSEDLLVLNGVVWVGETLSGYAKGHFKGYDVKTGKVVGEFDPDVESYWFHHRCHRGKATVNYVLSSRVGIEFIDPKKQTWDINHWVRGACLYGIMPANGLIYAPQHPCACYLESKLSGFNALAPGKRTGNSERTAEGRLLKGPAYGHDFPAAGARRPSPDDWATFRGDNARSGRASTKLPTTLKSAWSTTIGGRLSTSTVADGRVYLASIDNHTVHAVDAKSGRKLWEFTAGGRVDSPPTWWKGRLLFGSADGYVYCLKADNGALVWKFRAAPVDQRVMSFEQIESAWPVHGSIMIEKDIAWFVSGRCMFLDGGLHLYRLDPATGKVFSETVLNEIDEASGKNLQDFGGQLNMPVALPDILSCDGKYAYMHSQPFTLEGVRLPLKPWPYDKERLSHFTTPWDQDREYAHIFTPTGFVDDTWWHRTYWVYGSRFIGGWAGYAYAGKSAPAGRILVMDDDRVYGYGRKAKYYRWTTPIEHHLFAAARDSSKVELPNSSKTPARYHYWTKDVPFFVRAMLLSGKTLFLAGPKDIVDEDASFRKLQDPKVREQVAEQSEIFAGKHGGMLWAVDTRTVEQRSQLALDSIPVFDGMSAAAGRLYLSTVDGKLVCFE